MFLTIKYPHFCKTLRLKYSKSLYSYPLLSSVLITLIIPSDFPLETGWSNQFNIFSKHFNTVFPNFFSDSKSVCLIVSSQLYLQLYGLMDIFWLLFSQNFINNLANQRMLREYCYLVCGAFFTSISANILVLNDSHLIYYPHISVENQKYKQMVFNGLKFEVI